MYLLAFIYNWYSYIYLEVHYISSVLSTYFSTESEKPYFYQFLKEMPEISQWSRMQQENLKTLL